MKKRLWIALSAFSFILCGLLYVDSHSDILNIIKADYYFKRNSIDMAVKYYEQAFEAGSKNETARDNYVNLVINSPLNSAAQERLVKFIKYPINDEARHKANSFLTDLRYEIHGKYPDNYVSRTTYNQKIVRWSGDTISYGYIDFEKAPEYFVKEIDEAFSEWEKELEGIVNFKKVEGDADIIVCFNEANPVAEENEKYVAALTKPVIETNTLKNMITDYYITTPDGNFLTENQVYNIALHEIGHSLGFMGHSDYNKNVMYMATDNYTLSNDLRKKLTKADINTIKLLYKIKPDITNTKTSQGEYTKYLILGNEIDVANSKIREAKTYIQKVPNLPAGYIDLADGYIATEEYSKALKCLEKALMLAKDDSTTKMINYDFALIYYFISDYDMAKTYLDKSGYIENSESAVYLMAKINTALGKKAESIALYEDLLLRNPANIEYVIGLTNIYVKDKAYLKARNVLKDYVTKYPQEKKNPKLAPYGVLRAFL